MRAPPWLYIVKTSLPHCTCFPTSLYKPPSPSHPHLQHHNPTCPRLGRSSLKATWSGSQTATCMLNAWGSCKQPSAKACFGGEKVVGAGAHIPVQEAGLGEQGCHGEGGGPQVLHQNQRLHRCACCGRPICLPYQGKPAPFWSTQLTPPPPPSPTPTPLRCERGWLPCLKQSSVKQLLHIYRLPTTPE